MVKLQVKTSVVCALLCVQWSHSWCVSWHLCVAATIYFIGRLGASRTTLMFRGEQCSVSTRERSVATTYCPFAPSPPSYESEHTFCLVSVADCGCHTSEFQFTRTEEPLAPSWAANSDEDEPSPFAFTGAPMHMQAVWESQVSAEYLRNPLLSRFCA